MKKSGIMPKNIASISTIKRENLRDVVTNAIRAAVISGEMKPDVVYSAPTLSQQFGVSATPVREAMLDLMAEGLVAAVPNKGFLVLPMSDDDLDEITELRILIEPSATRRAAIDLPAEDIADLRTMAQLIVDAAQQKDLIAYVESDRKFHLRLLERAGNRRLYKIVSELRAQTRLYGLKSLVEHDELIDSATEHHLLLDLIEKKDYDAIEPMMRSHVALTRGIWATGSSGTH